jgi:hypothetical protein
MVETYPIDLPFYQQIENVRHFFVVVFGKGDTQPRSQAFFPAVFQPFERFFPGAP